MRLETANLSDETLGQAIGSKLRELNQTLAPVTAAILDDAKATIEKNLQVGLEAAAQDKSIFDGAAAINAQAAGMLQGIENERPHALGDPLRFLSSNGFASFCF